MGINPPHYRMVFLRTFADVTLDCENCVYSVHPLAISRKCMNLLNFIKPYQGGIPMHILKLTKELL